MQPDAPFVSPPASGQQPTSSAPQPDYSFLNEQPKKSQLPFAAAGFKARLAVVLVGFLILLIIFIVLKNLLSTPQIDNTAYLAIVYRQQGMLHILETDVSPTSLTQLSAANQDFASTAQLSLATDQAKMIGVMAAYKDKVNAKDLNKAYSSSVDQQFTNSLTSNTFNSLFNTEMAAQLGYYQQELKSAYKSTRSITGRELLSHEYSETKLMLAQLNSGST